MLFSRESSANCNCICFFNEIKNILYCLTKNFRTKNWVEASIFVNKEALIIFFKMTTLIFQFNWRALMIMRFIWIMNVNLIMTRRWTFRAIKSFNFRIRLRIFFKCFRMRLCSKIINFLIHFRKNIRFLHRDRRFLKLIWYQWRRTC